ncbi:DUF3575 domain-containing protein [Myroides sp. WP-1]|uniref:DUF3575 domain-containing protein n=1 Tax=Myroides sp. WP-1 TaxID=2759944 RepID=UPI0015FCECB9|nr:DUF3575 domain-containing protein [Myroides sp. WP-1]MBB1139480.1 DUF3575 domain-containing protein [Myroides sp. WP-1]
MKKIIAAAFLIGSILGVKAQAVNEVKINILNTIVIPSIELGYEHFIDHNQSIGVDVHFMDRFSYYHESKSKDQKFNTTSLALNYKYYFGGANGANGSGYSVSPFIKYRFGNFKEDKYVAEIDGVARVKTDMNSFIVGIGFGHKWTMGDSFAIEPFVNVARNFSSEVNDRFSAIEFNAGVMIGYRF